MDQLQMLLKQRNILCHEDCPIARYSTFRIGGTAKLAVFPKNREQLVRTFLSVGETGVRYAVVGRGSNLLFPDEFDGVLIFTASVSDIAGEGNLMEASAGASLCAIANRARNLSLGGMEFAAGIPGTLGGAVCMNAGAFRSCMAQVVHWVDCWNMDSLQVERFCEGQHGFAYRRSVYGSSKNRIVLAAGLSLFSREQTEIDALMEDYRRRRKESQPLEYPNAGSIFKNPEGDAAGRLIEACGLKGARVGGACISNKHANFIVNTGGASRRDVLELIERIRTQVLQQTGVELVCELQDLESIVRTR